MMERTGTHDAAGCRFAVVVSRFNGEITEGLLRGARDVLEQASVSGDDITLMRVPGAFELPIAALHAAETGRFDAVICLGCLIKGDTMHFEYIASAASHGIMDAAHPVPSPDADQNRYPDPRLDANVPKLQSWHQRSMFHL